MVCKGKLVAVEGVDDARLEDQVQRLHRWLNARGIAAEHTAEPTYGPVGTQIRLHRRGRLHVDPVSLALYEVADRMDHLGRPDGILSWLADGRYVLCARYVSCSYAHHLDSVDLDWLQAINARCRAADLTLFLDVAPDPERAGLYTNYKIAIDALRCDGQQVVTIDGRGSADGIFERCCHILASLGSAQE